MRCRPTEAGLSVSAERTPDKGVVGVACMLAVEMMGAVGRACDTNTATGILCEARVVLVSDPLVIFPWGALITPWMASPLAVWVQQYS
jgi:hypothetical protein